MALIVIALVVAGCGSGSRTKTPGANARSAFAWLRPEPPPPGWSVVRITNGATVAYPPGWRRVHGDAGTATAVLTGSDHRFLGYLNLTPRQGAETLGNWGRFRVEHNAEEGERNGRALAVGTGLRFRTGAGSCVRDSYTTTTGTRYVELACLVAGQKASSVIVGTSTPAAWRQVSPLLERAIASLTT
jgi:hypothetical protein